LPDGIALQLEIVGEKIQNNPMGIKGVEPRLFDIYDITKHKYLTLEEIDDFMKIISINRVKLIESGSNFKKMPHDELLKLAEGFYENGKKREGIVIRSKNEDNTCGERISFKVINLKYDK
jgi:ATP-dependent RNA circularization protein (DNA/RNA ligase family)